ncbi:ANK-REP-REGION domain-containing protein [Mycena chlorophos]|uniref:ANK-REP-REGION domain-containing protein n=1 Tax=Mycena chlorophos TaxID=658473 RepID=A0A8H6W1T0_MYCCL|nr:ANK-REP-REGION domain-containing protein [Mycena chlorophos]
MSSEDGASNNERLLAAARDDNEEMLTEVFEQGGFDINFQDGLGNTGTAVALLSTNLIKPSAALHYAASLGSTDVLELILEHEECDVDPINRLEKATPLHLAVRIEDPELRVLVVSSLLDAGANTGIKDKNGDTVVEVAAGDVQVLALIRKARAQAAVSLDDVASDDDASGSGSGSDDD